MADTKPGDKGNGGQDLKAYWTVGPGAAKIRWNTPGDFTRCHTHLADKVGDERANRICASWHHLMTGTWPGDSRNVGKK